MTNRNHRAALILILVAIPAAAIRSPRKASQPPTIPTGLMQALLRNADWQASGSKWSLPSHQDHEIILSRYEGHFTYVDGNGRFRYGFGTSELNGLLGSFKQRKSK